MAWAGPAPGDDGDVDAPIDPRANPRRAGVLPGRGVATPAVARDGWAVDSRSLRANFPSSPEGADLALPVQDAPLIEVTAVSPTGGHAKLRWSLAGADPEAALEFEVSARLQPSADETDAAEFILYRGPDRATFVSGLPDGVHEYRVRSRPAGSSAEPREGWGPWSAWAEVRIAHHPLALAWTLFGVGAALVACIVSYLIVADARARREERAAETGGSGA